jgi:hypothetical protein
MTIAALGPELAVSATTIAATKAATWKIRMGDSSRCCLPYRGQRSTEGTAVHMAHQWHMAKGKFS